MRASQCVGATYLSPQSSQPLLLGVRIDICSDDERDDVEEWHPSVLRQELLRKRQSQRRCNPADLHDRHEACLDRSPDLMEGPRASNDSHRSEVHAVLDR